MYYLYDIHLKPFVLTLIKVKSYWIGKAIPNKKKYEKTHSEGYRRLKKKEPQLCNDKSSVYKDNSPQPLRSHQIRSSVYEWETIRNSEATRSKKRKEFVFV